MTSDPAAKRRLLGQAAELSGLPALGGIIVITALVLRHLVRRGRLIRERLGPSRLVRPPEPPEPDESRRDSETTGHLPPP